MHITWSINVEKLLFSLSWKQTSYSCSRSFLAQLLFLIGTSLVLAGCQPGQSSQEVFDNYLYRLSNSLEIERHHVDKETVKSSRKLRLYPKKSELHYDIPVAKVNVLQFLQLSKCDLQRLIGQRNSSLGKLMSGYHSLLYEQEFLVLAKRCQETIEQDKALSAELATAIEYKKVHQGKLRWNAIFASDEIGHLFSLSSQALTHQQLTSNPIQLVEALEYLNFWLSEPSQDIEKLEQAYKTFATRKYIGELRLTMAMTVSALAQANIFIENRLSQKPLCKNQQGNQKFDVVNRVFIKFYIGEVQPMLAKLYQQGQILFSLIDELQMSLQPNQPFIAFWDSVYAQENSEWKRFNNAISLHTSLWQKLLKQCGRLPA